jgi:hypothetical protein
MFPRRTVLDRRLRATDLCGCGRTVSWRHQADQACRLNTVACMAPFGKGIAFGALEARRCFVRDETGCS